MSKTMEAIAVYELFNNYAIDDYLNVYRKDTGYLLDVKNITTFNTKASFANTDPNGV